eukprot:2964769-Rhodomonas_salina.1
MAIKTYPFFNRDVSPPLNSENYERTWGAATKTKRERQGLPGYWVPGTRDPGAHGERYCNPLYPGNPGRYLHVYGRSAVVPG